MAYGNSPFSTGTPFPGQGRPMGQQPGIFGHGMGQGGPPPMMPPQGQPPMGFPGQPNEQAFAHANPNAAFMRPQFPGGGMGQPQPPQMGGDPSQMMYRGMGQPQGGPFGQQPQMNPFDWRNAMMQRRGNF